MIATIHQPNFMPWYPFFQKVFSADLFIILTRCQFEKNGFQNRFKHQNKWHTMSVKKGLEPIKDKVYLNPEKDWNRIKTNLSQYSILNEFDEDISDNLAETNVRIILRICRMLGYSEDRVVLDHETDLGGTDRLVDICKIHNCDTYIAGISGRKYLEQEKFGDIELKFQDEKVMKKMSILEYLSES